MRARETPKPAHLAGFGLVEPKRTMGLEPTTLSLGNRGRSPAFSEPVEPRSVPDTCPNGLETTSAKSD